MFDRRKLARFTVTPPAEATLQTMCEMAVKHAGDDGWIAVGKEVGIVGEVMGLELGDADAPISLSVRVVESRPMVIDGAVLHRLQLRVVPSPAQYETGTAARVPRMA
jgi:hypothetical protein